MSHHCNPTVPILDPAVTYSLPSTPISLANFPLMGLKKQVKVKRPHFRAVPYVVLQRGDGSGRKGGSGEPHGKAFHPIRVDTCLWEV